MEFVRRAVIDVGTNSVKLLVADVTGREVIPVLEESKQTRLGKDFYETHVLQPEAIARTAGAVAFLAGNARVLKPTSLRVFATSAARDAENPQELTAAILEASGLTTEIISGEKEAEWSFQGVTSEARFADGSVMILDVGGGSTELILGCGSRQHLARSFPLGTVRLLEKLPHGNPPSPAEFTVCKEWLMAFMRDQVQPELGPVLNSPAMPGPIQLIGTGGTASMLGRMELKLDHFDRKSIEGVQLSLERVRSTREYLWRLPLAQRQEVPGLPRTRADVILTGVAIYEAVMEVFGLQPLNISTRGLRFAAVMS
jgi:exopolyphosphatase/guanosine-5'-triphosphate,3'-diphosphate pyrophosphatase